MSTALETVKGILEAYAKKDREAAERLIAKNFRFTSPLDNGIDRQTYFSICWPNSANIEAFDIEHIVADGERVFITYEATTKGGKRFRNTEVATVRDGKIVANEVYFGWNLPHDVPSGQHRDP